MLNIFLYSLSCVCALLVLKQYVGNTQVYKLPPKVAGALPILGITHLVIFYSSQLWLLMKLVFDDCVKKGGITYARIATDLYYMVTDPDDASTLANACPRKHFAFRFAKPWLGDGLMTSSGDIHKRHRKLIDPAFSKRMVDDFLVIFNEDARMLIQELALYVNKGFFDHTFVLRIKALKTFFATSLGVSGYEDEHFIDEYIKASDTLMYLVSQRLSKFWLQSDLIYKLSGLKKIEDEAVKKLRTLSGGNITHKKNEILKKNTLSNSVQKSSGKKFKPLLDLLLEYSDENAMTDKEIQEEVETAIVTGFDSTSNALVFITVMLGGHLDVQENLYQELLHVLGPDKDVEKDHLPNLVYTEAVIKETLRLYPPGSALLRYVEKDVKIKNYTLPAGAHCVISPYGIHKDPAWGPDADEFKPGRWLDPATLPNNPNTFFAFSLGRRSCVGKTYALTTMKVTLAHFFRRYKVLAQDLSKLRLGLDIMIRPIEGHHISIELR